MMVSPAPGSGIRVSFSLVAAAGSAPAASRNSGPSLLGRGIEPKIISIHLVIVARARLRRVSLPDASGRIGTTLGRPARRPPNLSVQAQWQPLDHGPMVAGPAEINRVRREYG